MIMFIIGIIVAILVIMMLVALIHEMILVPLVLTVFLPPLIGVLFYFIAKSIMKRRRREYFSETAKLERKYKKLTANAEEEDSNDRAKHLSALENELADLQAKHNSANAELEAQEAVFRSVSIFSADRESSGYLERLLQLMEGGRADTVKEAINITVQEGNARIAEMRRQEQVAQMQKMVQEQQEQYEHDMRNLRRIEEERLQTEKKRLDAVEDIRYKLDH